MNLEFIIYIGEYDLHSYRPLQRRLYDYYHQKHNLAPWIPKLQAEELTAFGLNKHLYDPDQRVLYETAFFDNIYNPGGSVVDRHDMHLSWVSGAPYALALLEYGHKIDNPDYINAGRAIINHICEGVAPCGLLYPSWSKTRGWTTGWNPVPHWIHSRTIGEAVLYILRAIKAEADLGCKHPDWEKTTQLCCEKIISLQNNDGNFGSYYHIETGQVEVWDGAGGLIWIPTLLLAAEIFNRPDFLQSAQKAGRYYLRFVEDAFIYGAPEDVHLTPTSEDGYNAIMAYLSLYESDKNQQWLKATLDAFEWTMTFRYLYNVDFPDETILGRYDYRTVGGDMASPANLHIHNYGLSCHAELLRLWEITRDEYIMHRLRDHLFCFLQFIARRDGDFGARKGMVTERWFPTDWDHGRGELLPLAHTWCAGLILSACLATSRFGDIIIDTDHQQVHVLEALKIINATWQNGLNLELHNCWEHDLNLKVVVYSQKPLYRIAVDKKDIKSDLENNKTTFRITLPAGETTIIRCPNR